LSERTLKHIKILALPYWSWVFKSCRLFKRRLFADEETETFCACARDFSGNFSGAQIAAVTMTPSQFQFF